MVSGQYKTQYEQSQKRYQDLVNGQSAFRDMVEQKLNEKVNYNKDLINQQSQLQEQSLALPSQLRSEFSSGPIRNPLQQEALIAQRQSNLGSSLNSVGNLLSARGQDQSKILGTAYDLYNSKLQGEQTAAENAWRLYQDALAQEEAARVRAAAAAQQAAYERYINNFNSAPDTSAVNNVAIETDDRSTGTKAVDSLLSKGPALNSLLSSTPVVNSLYNNFKNSKLAQNGINTIYNLLSSDLGKKYVGQSAYSKALSSWLKNASTKGGGSW